MTTAARVVVLEDFGVLAIQELDLPDPGPHQATVEILGSSFQWAQAQQVEEPPGELTIPGREATGIVRAVGEAVTRVNVDDVVLISPWPASSGRDPERIELEFEDGTERTLEPVWTWATDTVIDEQFLTPLPALSDREGASLLGETALTAYSAVHRTGEVGAGATVAVLGTAGTGLAIVALARAAGASTIIAVDRNDDRLALASSVGATATINSSADEAVAEIHDITGEGVDVFFDCLYAFATKGRPGTAAVKPGGRAVLVGSPGTEAHRAELGRFASSHAYHPVAPPQPGEDLPALFALIAEGRFDPGALVTMRWTIEAVNEAISQLENGDVVGQSIMVVEPLK